MSDFTMNSIGSLLSGRGVSAISKRTRVPARDVAKVLSVGIPTMLSGMKKNVSTAEGEASLSGALRDHSVADVSDMGAFMKGADLKDGKKILGHVLGSNQQTVVDQISRASGVTKGKTTTILALVAPLLLSLLGGQQNQSGSSFNLPALLLSMLLGGGQQPVQQQPSLLGSLLGGQTQPVQQPVQQQPSLLGSLFGGGQQVQQPVQQPAQQSSGLLGSLFGGAQQSQGGDFVLSQKPEQQVQQQSVQQVNAAQQQQSLLQALLGGQTQVQPEPVQEEQSSGLLDGLLSLFR